MTAIFPTNVFYPTHGSITALHQGIARCYNFQMAYERDGSIPEGMQARTYIGEPKPLGTVGDPVFDKFYRDHERMTWSLSDLGDNLRASVEGTPLEPGSAVILPQFKPELLTQTEVDSLTTSMLIESHNPVYTANLNSYPANRMDFRETNFLATWSYEEWRHFQASLMYLEAVAKARGESPNPASIPDVKIEEVGERLGATRAGRFGEEESKYTRVQLYGNTMLQELLTHYAYLKFSKRTKDPMLADLYLKMARDEMRHHVWYYDRLNEALHPDPEQPKKVDPQALEEFVELLKMFDMPGKTFIPDYEINPEYVREAISPDSTIGRLLVGKVDQLIGKEEVNKLLGNKDFADSLKGRGIRGRDLFALRMVRRLPVGR